MLISAKYFVRVLLANESESLSEDLAFEALKFGVIAMAQEELPEPISRGRKLSASQSSKFVCFPAMLKVFPICAAKALL